MDKLFEKAEGITNKDNPTSKELTSLLASITSINGKLELLLQFDKDILDQAETTELEATIIEADDDITGITERLVTLQTFYDVNQHQTPNPLLPAGSSTSSTRKNEERQPTQVNHRKIQRGYSQMEYVQRQFHGRSS
jgi:hypothetical protein